MKNNHGLALIYLLLPLTIFTLFAIGGMVVWNKTAVSPATTIIERIKETLPIPEEEKTKMPWEDSVCGNGICERCESRNECCNYPCVTDPITGNQMCPPPTCLGWCPQDCQEPPPQNTKGCIGQLRANWQCPENKWLKVSEGQRCCGDPSAPNLVCCAD